LKHSSLFLISFFFYCSLVFSQNADCDKVALFLEAKEKQVANLNLQDPDYIPLHYLLTQDIIKELAQFRKEVIPYFSECKTITFSELIDRYDEINNSIVRKYDSLIVLNDNVYLLFYEKALYEYQLRNEDDGDYFLQRSLQYHATFSNAILLKLNKLLSKNLFKESLSLLNTLYYDTQLDAEQEKEAIEFTDRFYEKLYHTGDSLLTMEYAAEALELFEILEKFCQNLPTSYCNDDYYRGVLSSKTGIYESYLTIAKVAEQRGILSISEKFYQYAQEYLENNPHLKNFEPKARKTVEKLEPIVEQKELSNNEKIPYSLHATIPKDTVVENVAIPVGITSEVVVSQALEENTTVDLEEKMPKFSPKELKEKYDTLVLQALGLCIKEDFTTSYKMFLEAKELEDCRCFPTDFRVDLMLKELEKFMH